MSERKTIRVRIAVAVSQNGEWSSAGWSGTAKDYDRSMRTYALETLAEDGVVHFVEADVPLPETQMVEGMVAT